MLLHYSYCIAAAAAGPLRSGDMTANTFLQLKEEKEHFPLLFLCRSRMSKTCSVGNGKQPKWDT